MALSSAAFALISAVLYDINCVQFEFIVSIVEQNETVTPAGPYSPS